MASIQQVELTVQDNAIHCTGCESRIHTIVKSLPGVVTVGADHQTQTINLAVDTDQTPIDAVKEKLEAAGFRTG